MAYRVEIAAPAAHDIDEAYTWLRDNHPAYAADWYSRLNEAVDSLALLPHRCPVAPEQTGVPFELRQLIVGEGPPAYRVLFTVLDDVRQDGLVVALRVRYAARDRLQSGDVSLPEADAGRLEP